jgi:hypothetical protein
MRSARKVWGAGALAFLLAANGGRAQMAAETAPGTTEDALHAMTQQAAVIFTGKVVAVRRVGGMDGATGVVEIEFAVDDAVRGVSGSTYTLREWAGLWAAGDQPLRAGQRYLMLLHAPSAAGLNSPVGGMDGAIPIRGEPAQAELGRGTRTRGWVANGDERTVDLRWVATRVVRPVSYRLESVSHPTALPVRLRAEAMLATPAQGTEAADISPGREVAAVGSIAPAAQDAGYATVLALLRGWEKRGDAAR